MLTSINHIGIAVSDLETSKNLYKSLFNISSFHEEIVESQKVSIASFSLNGILIELTAPISEDSLLPNLFKKRVKEYIILHLLQILFKMI